MKVKVRYFAQLREEAGRDEESLETSARTPGELYEELKTRYGFPLGASLIRAAVDDEFQTWDFPLVPGAVVVFIPPVAGG